MKQSSVYDCTMIELDKHHHEKGNITVVENGKTVPFEVKRTYYLYDVPGGEVVEDMLIKNLANSLLLPVEVLQ